MSEIIQNVLNKFIDNQEIAGAVVLVRKDGKLVCDFASGYANIDARIPVSRNTIFRLASMSKPIGTIAMMQLVESGKAGLYDNVSKYIAEFTHMRVCKDKLTDDVYEPDPDNPTNSGIKKEIREAMAYVPAVRGLTIFDLLNHSSGLGMGPMGCTLLEEIKANGDTVLDRARKYATLPLDFQPGTASGYSAVANFEVIEAIVEIVSGEAYPDYLKNHVFTPMGIKDMDYFPTQEQQSRIPRLYEYTEGKLVDVSDIDRTWNSMDPLITGHPSAAGGLYGSMEEYEKIAHMFVNQGLFEGKQILKSDTVDMIGGKGISHESRLFPPIYWGLGVSVMEFPEMINSSRVQGSFGWSGAYGTHMVIDPINHLEFVLGVNRCNIGGAGSYVSFAVEDAVKEAFL